MDGRTFPAHNAFPPMHFVQRIHAKTQERQNTKYNSVSNCKTTRDTRVFWIRSLWFCERCWHECLLVSERNVLGRIFCYWNLVNLKNLVWETDRNMCLEVIISCLTPFSFSKKCLKSSSPRGSAFEDTACCMTADATSHAHRTNDHIVLFHSDRYVA